MRLRIALLGTKPLPWRRVEVSAATTLAGLHAVIQAAIGWEDLHLHCFCILGRRYDGEHDGLTRMRLADLRLRAGERFSYTYNHSAPWEHELRVEAIGPGLPVNAARAPLPELRWWAAPMPAGMVPRPGGAGRDQR